jgi:hypothetical protein
MVLRRDVEEWRNMIWPATSISAWMVRNCAPGRVCNAFSSRLSNAGRVLKL